VEALCGCKGIGIFCRNVGQARAKQRGKLSQPVVLAGLQGKGHVRQRSLNEKSIFVTFDASKVKRDRGQERVRRWQTCGYTKYCYF